MKPNDPTSHAAQLGRLMRAPQRVSSRQRKAIARAKLAAEAPPPAPRRGTPEHSKARNARRNARARSARRLLELNATRATGPGAARA